MIQSAKKHCELKKTFSHTGKEKTSGCQRKFNWENALVNSIGKGSPTGPHMALVNTPKVELLMK